MTENLSEICAYRVIDAARNRANEGIRVVEDYVRMAVGDQHLSGLLKNLRHEVTFATQIFKTNLLIAARDAVSDVGRTIRTESEYKREHASDLVQSNLSRVQQALRTIEEFSKTISVDVAGRVEQLRYDVYTIEKAVMTTMFSLQDISGPSLYVLTDCRGSQNEFRNLVSGLINAGVDLIQLRDTTKSDRELIKVGRMLTELTRGSSTRWIMNDRPDLAVTSNADGVHLGQSDMKVSEARRIVGTTKLIGVSTHDLDQARHAVLDGANYIGVGPVFHSSTKQFESVAGVSFVKQVALEIRLPAFAIGGLCVNNVDQIINAGLSRVAVSSSIVGANDPIAAAKELLAKLHSTTGEKLSRTN